MRIAIKGLGEIGYIADQEPFELAPNAITELQNMRMRAGWAERVRGHRQIAGDLTFPPYHLAAFSVNAAKYLLELGLRNAQVDDGGTRTDITPAAAMTMNPGQKWTSTFLAGYEVLNNQADAPYSWNGNTASVLQPLANWTATHRAKAMRSLRYHLVALNITKAGVSTPHRVKVSGAAAPGTLPTSWDETDVAQDTDEFDLRGDGVLVDGVPMGETLILYKERSVGILRWAPSNQSRWSCEPLPFTFGMLSQNCGVNVPGIGHVVLTQGDVVRFDGNTVESVLEARAREWLFAQMDVNWFSNSFLALNEQKAEVLICFPEAGNTACTKALVWNYRSDKLSKRDLPNVLCGTAAAFNYAVDTFDSDSVSFNSESVLTFDSGSETVTTNDTRLLMGTSAKEVFLMDSGDMADGANFTAYIERTGLNDFGPGYEALVDRSKRCKRLWLDIDAVAGTQLQIYIGASRDPITAPTYEAAVTFTVGTDRWIDAFTCGIFLAYKISATGSAFWRVRSVAMEVQDAGAY